MQFIREQSFATHHQTVNLTRALLCELVAEKILRRYNEHNPGPRGLLKLANILVAGFEPFQGAPEAHVDKSFSDLLENLDAASFLTGTARRGRYVLQGDFSYASTSDTVPLPLGQSAKAKVRQISSTLTVGGIFCRRAAPRQKAPRGGDIFCVVR